MELSETSTLAERYEALIIKIAQLEAENDEESKLRKRLADLLEQTANALKGESEPLHLHDWSDLPEVARKLVAENKRLQEEQVNPHVPQ